MDPLTANYPSWSPYPFAMNRPIDGIDLDGLEFLRKTNPQGETTVLNLTIGVDNAIFDTYGKTNVEAELSRQYSLLISNSIDGAKGDITTIPIEEGAWNTPLHYGQSKPEKGSSFVGGANIGGQANIMPLYDAEGNLKSLEDVVNTILHESIHVYITSHPFEQAYGEDDQMYFIEEDENNQFFFESIPGVTNPRMKENIMMYGYIFLDNVKLSEFWNENGQPLHLTNSQLDKIYGEIQKMKEHGKKVYQINRVQEDLNDAINETGKPEKKN